MAVVPEQIPNHSSYQQKKFIPLTQRACNLILFLTDCRLKLVDVHNIMPKWERVSLQVRSFADTYVKMTEESWNDSAKETPFPVLDPPELALMGLTLKIFLGMLSCYLHHMPI